MADAVNEILTSGYEVDEVNYNEMMDDELVEQIETGSLENGQHNEKQVTDAVFRTMLEKLKQETFKQTEAGSGNHNQQNVMDLLENEVMDELKDASMKND